MSTPNPTPRWMKTTLILAGIYNLLWGAWTVLRPGDAFALAGMQPLNHPVIWQCVGMIVGVYGIAYLIASSDPLRHWPVVFAGLLGKVLGPLGMWQAMRSGELPSAFALHCVTNDLIWWLPFGLIMAAAWRNFREEPASGLPDEPALLRLMNTTNGESIAALSARQPVLLVLLRHEGCVFCRNAMSDIARLRPKIEAAGAAIVLGHMSTPEDFASFACRYGLAEVPAVADPDRVLYRGLGLKRGKLRQLLGPRVWWAGFKSFVSGHRVGLIKGDSAQMPGAFLIRDGKVIRRHEYRDAGDRPDYVDFVR